MSASLVPDDDDVAGPAPGVAPLLPAGTQPIGPAPGAYQSQGAPMPPMAGVDPLAPPPLPAADAAQTGPLPAGSVPPLAPVSVPAPGRLNLANPSGAQQQLADLRTDTATAARASAGNQGVVDKARAGIVGDIAGGEADLGASYLQQQQQIAAQQAKARGDAEQEVQRRLAARDQANKDAGRSYWDDLSTGGKVASTFFIALGGLGSALQNAAAIRVGRVGNAQNTALQNFQNATNMDFQRKREAIMNARDAVVEARAGVADADKAREILLGQVRDDYALGLADLKTKGQQRLATLGASQADIDQNAALAKINDELDKFQSGEVDKIVSERLANQRLAVQERGQDMRLTRAIGAGKADQEETKALDWANGLIEKDKDVVDARKKSREAAAALDQLRPGPNGKVDGLSAKAAIDALYTAQTGLGARPTGVQSWLDSIGGAGNRIGRAYEKLATGNATDADVAMMKEVGAKIGDTGGAIEQRARERIAKEHASDPRVRKFDSVAQMLAPPAAPKPPAAPQYTYVRVGGQLKKFDASGTEVK